MNKLCVALFCLSLSACVAGKVPPSAVEETAPAVAPQPPVAIAEPDPERDVKAAGKALRTGNPDVALGITRQLADQHPLTPWYQRSLFLTELALIQADSPAEADAAMLRALDEYPELADYALFNLAEYHFQKARYSQAAVLYEELLARYPQSSLAIRSSFRRGRALLESSAYIRATEALRSFLKDHPGSAFAPEAGIGLGKALTAEGETSEAVKTYRDVWVRYPGNSTDRDVETALAELKGGGIEIPEPTPAEYYERGQNLFRLGAYERAIEAFEQVLKKGTPSPKRPDALFRIGVAAYHLGQRSEAVAKIERMVRDYPSDPRTPEALSWLGKAYTRLNDWDKAKKIYKKIIDRFPGSEWADDALFVTANIHREEEERKTAIRYYERVTSEYPGSRFADSAIWWRAWLYYSDGDLKNAGTTLRELIDRFPRSSLVHQARYWQGRIAEQQGDQDRARVYYDQLIHKGPYTYYGSRALERIASGGTTTDFVVMTSLPMDQIGGGEGAGPDDPYISSDGDEAPPVWNDDTKQLLVSEPAFRKTYELMHLDMKKEAAAELACLKENMPQTRSALLGLSKAFYELGDYHRSVLLILRNYERFLDGPGKGAPEDLWRLAYPRAYWESIQYYARKYGQDPYFIASVIRQESRFQTDALSPAGARGLMQVMPATGQRAARQIRLQGFTSDRLYDADTVINIGTWYISNLMKRFNGDPLLAAAAYNAGPDAVAGWIAKNGYDRDRDVFVESIPYTETRGYVKKVLRNYAEYKRIYGAETVTADSDVQDWD